ncbi:hypothetical protein BDY21DRAFT_358831 [Lineolata rhizophorae]|uniref:C2H2-type domain-containing protein n=1 Tax=Lineolata rhizophorae TaxID=578093 RepID=A0A6A6NLD5_9PEZI|nr:hypothetical protein BDY21DRAFT_358831 [Lineolata rhizophorae]
MQDPHIRDLRTQDSCIQDLRMLYLRMQDLRIQYLRMQDLHIRDLRIQDLFYTRDLRIQNLRMQDLRTRALRNLQVRPTTAVWTWTCSSTRANAPTARLTGQQPPATPCTIYTRATGPPSPPIRQDPLATPRTRRTRATARAKERYPTSIRAWERPWYARSAYLNPRMPAAPRQVRAAIRSWFSRRRRASHASKHASKTLRAARPRGPRWMLPKVHLPARQSSASRSRAPRAPSRLFCCIMCAKVSEGWTAALRHESAVHRSQSFPCSFKDCERSWPWRAYKRRSTLDHHLLDRHGVGQSDLTKKRVT